MVYAYWISEKGYQFLTSPQKENIKRRGTNG
jgi:hypothetical protein